MLAGFVMRHDDWIILEKKKKELTHAVGFSVTLSKST